MSFRPLAEHRFVVDPFWNRPHPCCDYRPGPVGTPTMNLLTPSLLLLCCCGPLLAEDIEIERPRATDPARMVTVEMDNQTRHTGRWDPRARTLTKTIGSMSATMSIDPSKVAHWYEAPEPEAAKAPAATPTAAPAAAKAPPEASPAKANKNAIHDRLVRYLAMGYQVDAATTTPLSTGKLMAMLSKQAADLAKAPESDRDLRNAALADIKIDNALCAVFQNRDDMNRDAMIREVSSKSYPSQTAKTAAEADFNLMCLQLYKLPLETLTKIAARAVLKPAPGATGKAATEPFERSLIVDQAHQVWSPITDRHDAKISVGRRVRFHVTATAGLLPRQLEVTYDILGADGSPLPFSEGTTYSKIGINSYSWEWDAERYAKDPGRELDEFTNGTYSAYLVVEINNRNLPKPPTKNRMEEQSVINLLKAPTTTFVATIHSATIDGTTWEIPTANTP